MLIQRAVLANVLAVLVILELIRYVIEEWSRKITGAGERITRSESCCCRIGVVDVVQTHTHYLSCTRGALDYVPQRAKSGSRPFLF